MALLLGTTDQEQNILKNGVFYLYYVLLSLWIGGISLFTFLVTPLIFRYAARDMAGEIVGWVFPGYFLYNLILSLLAVGDIWDCPKKDNIGAVVA